jgi:hypothetical protein
VLDESLTSVRGITESLAENILMTQWPSCISKPTTSGTRMIDDGAPCSSRLTRSHALGRRPSEFSAGHIVVDEWRLRGLYLVRKVNAHREWPLIDNAPRLQWLQKSPILVDLNGCSHRNWAFLHRLGDLVPLIRFLALPQPFVLPTGFATGESGC